LNESSPEEVRDFEVRLGIELEELHRVAKIFFQKVSGGRGARVGYDESNVEIFRRVLQRLERTVLRQIGPNRPILDTEIGLQSLSKVLEKMESACHRDHIDRACGDLPRELSSNAGRRPGDERPGAELLFVEDRYS